MIDSLSRAARLLAGVPRLVVLTGAGMSQESGIPTFREASTGLWSRFNPEELATEAAFRANPPRVYSWYIERLRQARTVQPNAGHVAVAALERRFSSVVVVTQNVDGLHRRAGSTTVLELHGSLERFRCVDCGAPADTEELLRAVRDSRETLHAAAVCHACDGLMRPGVVWFGEMLPERETAQAWAAARECDAMLVVGTSAQVFPAADLPRVALAAGAGVIEINPEPTPISPFCSCFVRESAARALPRLESLLVTREKHDR